MYRFSATKYRGPRMKPMAPTKKRISSTMVIVGWIQFGALMLAALCTLRPAVGRWLPAPRALRAGKLLRSDGGRA